MYTLDKYAAAQLQHDALACDLGGLRDTIDTVLPATLGAAQDADAAELLATLTDTWAELGRILDTHLDVTAELRAENSDRLARVAVLMAEYSDAPPAEFKRLALDALAESGADY